jgi:hypothetical protein
MTIEIKQVNDEFSVSAQIGLDDVQTLAAQGIKSLICNRPDGEAGDQTNVTEIESAAAESGMEVAYLPVISGDFTDAEVSGFLTAIERLIVANNLLEDMGLATGIAHYNGYGSCPLTVERGKVVLAEFGHGGKLLPSFPHWVINGQRPSRLAWILKEKILPPVYWKAMLKGKEWMVDPQRAKTRTTTD